MRELQGRWPGLHWGRWEVAEGLQSLHRAPVAACGRWAGRDGGERTQQETLADRDWRELAGTFGCPLGGSGTDGAVRQEVESLAAVPGRG